MAGFLPASEQDLQRMVPGSNRAGAFPRDSLLGEERVLFEARPGMATWAKVAVAWGAIWYLISIGVGIA
ncbi:MAG: hypothetical protein KGJ23_14005, partial [Euryarchaeota archaeon]|nr:hypothetical protein [Euryarchaeota archaeon]